MATTNKRAITVNVGVMQAELSIRKALSSMSLNFPSPTDQVERTQLDLAALGSKVFNSTGRDTALTILRCSNPVVVTYVLKILTGIRVSEVTVTQVVNKFLMLDDNVGSFEVENVSTTLVSSIIFIQG